MRKLLYILMLLTTAELLNAGFIENRGQFDRKVLYFAKTADCNIWIDNNAITFDYSSLDVSKSRYYGSVVSLKFGEENNFNPIAVSPSKPKSNFFRANQAFTNIAEFDSLIVKDIYSNIDLILYFKNGCLAYDFLLKPYSDPQSINISIEGAGSLQIQNNSLIVSTPFIEQKHSDLHTYDNFSKARIKSNFVLNDGNKISFQVENFDNTKSITIDPVIYSTFLGGAGYDNTRAMEFDSAGNIIIAGTSNSINYPTTLGSFDRKLDTMYNFYDVVVSKFDSTGKNLLFSTFLGGYGDDYAECLALDTQGNIYISGYTLSLRSFPYTKNAIDTFDIGGFDLFFTKLKHSGDSILFSTLYGGKGDDFAQAIALDKLGAVYITGYTKSTDFRVSPMAYDTSSNGGIDAFALKLSANNYLTQYSTYFGGSFDDYGQTIAIDASGGAIIGGITRSTNFPTTQFAFDRISNDSIPNGSIGDAFLLKLNANGSALVFSTYLGGKGRDNLYGLCLDKSGDIYVAGLTESEDFPVRAGAFDETYNNKTTGGIFGDIFVSKIKYTGDSLQRSTFLGGRGTERAQYIALDTIGNVYVIGTTTSSDFPVSRKAFQKHYSDSTDIFVSKLSPNLDKLLYSTYIGGRLRDVGNSISPLEDLSLWITGWTASPDFPTSSDAFQKVHNDSSKSDIFLLRLKPNLIDISFEESIGTKNIKLCRGDSVYLGADAEGGFGTLFYEWSPSTGVAYPDEPFTLITPQASAQYVLTAYDSFGNTVSDTVFITVLELPKPIIIGSRLVLTGSTVDYSVTNSPDDKYEWFASKGTIISGQGTNAVKVKWTDSTTIGSLKVVQTNIADCMDSNVVNINIGKNFTPTITINGNTKPCIGDTVYLAAAAGYFYYSWSNGAKTRQIAVTSSGKYSVFVSDSLGFGGNSDTLDLVFTPAPNPTILGLTTVKPNYSYTYIASGNPESIFTWIISGGIILSGQGNDTITIRWNNTPSGTLVVEEQTANGCVGRSSSININIGGNFKPKIRILGSSNICQGDSILLDAGYGFSVYQWSNGESSRFISVSTADTFYCFVSDNYGFAGMTDTVITKLLPGPEKPFTSIFGNQFTCLNDSLPIQWYFYNQVIPGANNKLYIADIPGVYKVCVRGNNGCQTCSDAISYLVSVRDEVDQVAIYPNPAQDYLNIDFKNMNYGEVNLAIYNVLGEKVYQTIIFSEQNYKLNISNFPKGIYIASFNIANQVFMMRFIKK